MSTNNNIPFVWNEEQDNTLFSSLFPQGLNAPSFGNNIQQLNTGNSIFGSKHWKYLKRTSLEIEDIFFNNSSKIKNSNLTLIQDPNCNCEIKPQEIIVFYEENNKDGFQTGEDTYLFKIKIFNSTRGEIIQQIYFECDVAEDEAAFFIENNTGDNLSRAVMYAKFGSKVKKELILQLDKKGDFYANVLKIPGVDENIIKKLIENGVYEEKAGIIKTFAIGFYKFMSFVGIPAKVIGWISKKIGEFFIEILTIPDKIWDSNNEEYFLDKENLINSLTINTNVLEEIKEWFKNDSKIQFFRNIIPDFVFNIINTSIVTLEAFINNYNKDIVEKVNDIYKQSEINMLLLDNQYSLSEIVALNCGILNGLVDFIGGLFIFFGQIAQNQYDIGDDLEKYLDYFDSFCDTIKNLKPSDIGDALSGVYNNIKNYLKENEQDDLNYDKVAYISGYTIAFIGTFFIPFAAFAKPVEVISKLEKGLFPTELIEKISQSTVEATNYVITKSQKAVEEGLTLIRNILTLLRKGGAAIKEFLKDIWKKIADWFIANKIGFAKKIKDAFFKDGKTEELFRKIGKKINLAGQEILTSSDIKQLRRLLQETFEVSLEFVDQNPLLKAKLKDWTKRRVAGSFNMLEGVMYLRKSVTAYTVQHEMFHMKLWYKMTKEFPELQQLFQKTLGRQSIKKLFHEEYVLAEFMKNPNKWEEADLLNDLENINGLRRELDLPVANLEYYKKWNLEQELLKFK